MSDDTRITTDSSPKKTRITAEPPSQADTRICSLRKEEEPSFLWHFWTKYLWHSSFLLAVLFFAFSLWQRAGIREQQIKIQRKQVEIEKLKQETDRLQQELQRLEEKAQRDR